MKQLPILALLRCWRQNEIAHVSCMYNSPQVNGWQQFNSFRLKSGLFPTIGPHGEKRRAKFGIKFLVQTETKKLWWWWWWWYVWRTSRHPPLREVTINSQSAFWIAKKRENQIQRHCGSRSSEQQTYSFNRRLGLKLCTFFTVVLCLRSRIAFLSYSVCISGEKATQTTRA